MEVFTDFAAEHCHVLCSFDFTNQLDSGSLCPFAMVTSPILLVDSEFQRLQIRKHGFNMR
jgi:hypothetical protein